MNEKNEYFKLVKPLLLSLLLLFKLSANSHSAISHLHSYLRTDMKSRYGDLCKEEAFGNHPVVSVFSRQDIEAILNQNSKYPLRPPQEIISHYRRNRQDRYTTTGLVNE